MTFTNRILWNNIAPATQTLTMRDADGNTYEMEVGPRRVCPNTLALANRRDLNDDQKVAASLNDAWLNDKKETQKILASISGRWDIMVEDDADAFLESMKMLADKQSHVSTPGWAILKNPKV